MASGVSTLLVQGMQAEDFNNVPGIKAILMELGAFAGSVVNRWNPTDGYW